MSNIYMLLSDSLSLVRTNINESSGKTSFKKTYPYLLSEMSNESSYYLHKGFRAATTRILVDTDFLIDNIDLGEIFKISIQLGICDCAPRIMRQYEIKIIQFLRKIKLNIICRIYIKFKNSIRFFLTKVFPFTWVSEKEFKLNLEEFISYVRKKTEISKIIFISILIPSKVTLSKSYGYKQNVDKYNAILKEVIMKNTDLCCLLDINDLFDDNSSSFIIDDGIHMSNEGHYKLAQTLLKYFESN